MITKEANNRYSKEKYIEGKEIMLERSIQEHNHDYLFVQIRDYAKIWKLWSKLVMKHKWMNNAGLMTKQENTDKSIKENTNANLRHHTLQNDLSDCED